MYGPTMSLARPANIVVMKDGNDVQSSAGSIRDAAVRQAFLDALPIPAALFANLRDPIVPTPTMSGDTATFKTISGNHVIKVKVASSGSGYQITAASVS